ncbi:MAG: GNAT family N-acetyltransferase [Dehalococcoidia bacterium]
MATIIREAEERDLPRILALYQQLALGGDTDAPEDHPRLVPAFRRIRDDPQQTLLVLELDGAVMGSLVLIIVPNLSHHGAPWAEVENVVVDESLRGSGYGRLLMEHAERLAIEADCYKLQLMSHWDRKDEAHPFYERLGYGSPARAFRKYFKGGG